MKKKKSLKTARVKTKKKAAPRKDKKEKTKALLKSLLAKEQIIKYTEEALLESIKRLRDFFEQSPLGIGLHDDKGELLLVNNSYLKIFGLNSFNEIKQQNLFKASELSKEEIKGLRSGKIVQYEAEYDFGKAAPSAQREGIIHVLYIISPIFRDKKIIGHMAQVQDITERKKIAESQRLAQLGRLLSDMAHEINNPLMIISGNAELAIMEGISDPKVADALKIVLDQCFFAQDVIQRLLKYSRIGKISKSKVDINRTVDLIVGILEPHFRSAKIKFKKEIKPGLPAALAHEKQLQEVLMNIIRNSADAMPDGGLVFIRAFRDKNFLKIEVEDTGEGMSQNVLEKVFEPFFTTKQKGTGLGLAVCHTIIQEHGGDLRYKSKPGKGTTATIALPLTPRKQ
jgi:two-component system sensor histidine kinase AtoS